MVKGKVEEVEGATEVTPVEPEATPPTAEERLATLQSELATTKEKLAQTEKGLSSAQATLTRKDLESKSQAGLASRIEGIEDSMQILAGMLSKGELSPEDAQGYKQEFANLKRQREEASNQAQIRARQEEYATQAQSIHNEALEVYKDNPNEIFFVDYTLDRGDLEGARARVERAKGEKKGKPVETPAEMEARIRKEIEIQKGERDAETGKPSGSGETLESLRQKDIDKMSFKQKQEHLKALREGALNV